MAALLSSAAREICRRYALLVARVDDFSATVSDQLAPALHCRPGCDACCQRELSVLPLELYAIRCALDRCTLVSEPVPVPGVPCPLLDDRCCSIYPHRPIICRTHGLPLLVDRQTGRRDCCPRNCTGPALAALPSAQLLDLERLNTILVSLNRAFAARAGIDPARRLPLHLINAPGG